MGSKSSVMHQKSSEREGLERLMLTLTCGEAGVRSTGRPLCGGFEIYMANQTSLPSQLGRRDVCLKLHHLLREARKRAFCIWPIQSGEAAYV